MSKTNLISIYTHCPEPKPFERMLRILHNQGYRFVDLEELLVWYKDWRAFEGEKLCFVSLDDGFASNVNLLDACERYHTPLTIFVATRPLTIGNYWFRYLYSMTNDKNGNADAMKLPYDDFCLLVQKAEQQCPLSRVAMTPKQVKEISQHPLVTIGSHTVTHTILPQMPDDVLHDELIQSKHYLEELIGKPCKSFSYPNGSFMQRDVEAVREVYEIAFTVEQRNPRPNDDLMLVPRIGVTCAPVRDQLKLWGVWPWLKKCCSIISK